MEHVEVTTPWSYSHLSTYEHCARQFQWKYVLKKKEEKVSDEILWGNKVDSALAERAKGYALPEAMKPYEYIGQFLDHMRTAGAKLLPKYKFGLTADMKPTTFFGQGVWYRGEFDLVIKGDKSAFVDDYKTGKQRDDNSQLKLYAATGFVLWPETERIVARYRWLASKQTSAMEFKRDAVPVIWQEMMPRIAKMERERDAGGPFKPTPSGLCSWCPVTTCEHWRVR
jgi:hypothetical protein